MGVFAGPPNNNEDCLYLNVVSPVVDAKEKLPVIVWVHGGGDFCGESNDYDATKLASSGRTVVVTFNYRLGLLGWLAHPALDAEGHLFGNYGLLDQQFVLKWVQQNIGSFGGDKTRVTLAGQSAGSQNTESNLVSRLAAGLFHRAILQSIVEEPAPLNGAEAAGSAFAVAAGCGPGASAAVAACLRHLTASQIAALSGTEKAAAAFLTGPIADGKILPIGGLIAAIKNGKFNHMPVMSGTTKDESNFVIGIAEYFSGPPRTPPTEKDFNEFVNATLSGPKLAGTVDKVLARYPLSSYATPQLAMDAVRTDYLACAQRSLNRLLARQVPVYTYEFDDRTAPSYLPAMPQFEPLAYHTADIQYLFTGWHGGPLGLAHRLDQRQEELSNELIAAWGNFARTGNPNGSGNAPWPRFEIEPGKRALYLSENIPALSTFTDVEFSAVHRCGFWDTISTH